MGFSELERIKVAEKVLFASVKNADPNTQWYEAINQNRFVLKGNQIWTNPNLQTLLDSPQATLASAQAFAATVPTVVDDVTAPANAIRLTPIPGINNTYVALATYNDFSSERLDNWIQPQFVPQSNGQPSLGYTVQLYDGDPNAGGTFLGPTQGQSGSGINTTVGWIWDYGAGLLLLSEDYSIADPYVLGFRYIGSTAVDASSDLSEKIIEDAVCFDDDSVGDCVRIVSQRDLSGRLMVGRIDITAQKKACGIIISKSSPTACKVQLHGIMSGVYTGLTPGESYMIDTASRLTTTLPTPPASGFVYVQHMGHAVSDDELFIHPNNPIKRVDG